MIASVILRGRFKPGVSGHPGGRGKNSSNLASALQRKLPPEEFATKVIDCAEAGERWALEFIANRYWPASQKLELVGEVGQGCTHGPFVEPFTSTEEVEAAQVLTQRVAVGEERSRSTAPNRETRRE